MTDLPNGVYPVLINRTSPARNGVKRAALAPSLSPTIPLFLETTILQHVLDVPTYQQNPG